MKRKVKITRIRIDVRLLAMIILLAFVFNLYLRQLFNPKYVFVSDESLLECPIIYTKVECFNRKPIITFKNPSNMDYTNIRIIVPKEGGKDIYKVNEPLLAGDVKSLFLNYSSCKIEGRRVKFGWCCGERCYEIDLKNPKPIVSVERTRLEECDKLPVVRKLFCYADIAEVTNNISVCYLINDADISSLCFAQLTLNKTRCEEIKDENLKEACKESVKTKIYWKCRGLSGVEREFCYVDVAKVTNNITVCYTIRDNDIKSLCLAKLTSDKSKCLNIVDKNLRDVCIRSVR